MKIFKLVNINDFIIKEINNYVINEELNNKLIKTKQKIDNYQSLWEIYKKNINLYEYIYISNNNINNICKINPISRSYFKLHEILHDFSILNNINDINICSIAESPGGFIQSLLYNIEFKNINIQKYYGISLISNDKKIPSWNRNIIKNKNIDILYGLKKNGDICDIDNIKSFIEIIGENKCDIVTCDGGIDYSDNYNNQELLSYDFIFYEILLSLHIQKNKGTLILKMFDLLNFNSIKILYLLNLCYSEINIIKPYTSRNTNSEKYIVCLNYKQNNKVLKLLKTNCYTKKINIDIPKKFIECINEYNNIFVNQQISNINTIINDIENKNIIKNDKQISKAIEWCKIYNLPINNQ